MESGRILILDDEPLILDILCNFVRSLSYELCPTSAAEAAFVFLRSGGLQLAIVDVGAHGVQVTREAITRNVPCVMMSGRPVIFEIGGLGTVLQKPFALDALKALIEKTVIHHV